ncbi:leucine-rich repeat protein [Tannerella forsythia]
MKQVKHFSIWIITLFLGLAGSTVSAWAQQYDFTQGGLYYKIHGSDVHIVSENATSPYNTQGGNNFTIQKTVTHGGNTYNVTKIGAHAFEDRNILSINILADITEIGESAFIGNYLLWSCYLRGNGLTSIGKKAFYSCQSLRSLDIPESVTSIGEKAFGKCFALKPRVHWMNSGSIPPIQENVFEDIGISPEYSVLYVPENTMLEYLNRNVWSKFFIVEDVLLSFRPNVVVVEAAGGTIESGITSGSHYRLSTTDSWITNPYFGSPENGSQIFSAKVAPNTGPLRSGKVTATMLSGEVYTLTIVQKGTGGGASSLSATPLITATHAAETGKTVTVTASGVWTTATTESWITGLPTSPTTGNGTFTFNVAANPGSAHRIGEITVTDGTLTQKVIVVQAGTGGSASSLWATPLITATHAAATGKTVTVTASGSWTTATTAVWITGLPTSPTTGNGTFTFNVAANTGNYRIGEITVSDGTLTQKVIVVQDGTTGTTPPPTVIEKIVEKIVEKEVPPREVPVSSVKLNKPSLMLENVKTAQLKATVTPANATNPFLYWQSSDPFIASVDGSGLVTIHKKGKATITVKATDGSGKSASCEIEVLSAVANETIDGLRVYAAGGALHLTLPKAETTHIYNVNGAMVKMLALPSGDHVQPLAPGVYVVRVGEHVTKVMVK